MSKVCLIQQKQYNWSQILHVICSDTSQSHNYLLTLFSPSWFFILHAQVVANIVDDRTVSQNMMIWIIQHFWWVHIYTKQILVQIFCIVYFLKFSFPILILEPQIYIQTKVIDSQQKTVLSIFLWSVVKEILCSCNPLVSFFFGV